MKPLRFAIVGTGPVGLEAALHARSLGHEVTVYERGEVTDGVGAWGFSTLFSPWRMNTTELGRAAIGLNDEISGPVRRLKSCDSVT